MSYTPSIIRRGKIVDVIRFFPIKFVKGLPTPKRTALKFQVRASVQPVTGRERLQVPEGDRNREHIFLYTKENICVDDTIIYNRREFEVQVVDDWEDQNLNLTHKRCRAMLKDVNKQNVG